MLLASEDIKQKQNERILAPLALTEIWAGPCALLRHVLSLRHVLKLLFLENSPAVPAGIRTRDLSITSPAL